MVMPDPAVVEGVRSVLLKLRTHTGLTEDRLRATEVDVDVLANLPAVRVVTETGVPVEQAIVQVVAGLVDQLDTNDLIIVDVTLALGVLRGRVGENALFADLYAAELSARREALARHWVRLHQLLGVATDPTRLTVRSLRGPIEANALGALAARCVDTAAGPEADPRRHEAVVPTARPDHDKSVVIVGGAVMDHIYVVDRIPTPNTSAAALSRDEHPGGKGLNLAVAGAKLGLATRLIAAVGKDENAQRILEYMGSESLPTDLIKQIPNVRTPVTTVQVTEAGESSTTGWKNEAEVRHTVAELRELRSVLRKADAVLVTFEPAPDEVLWALKTASSVTKPGHLLLVQPSPPMDSPQRLYGYLSSVNYLVGTEWELRSLLPAIAPDVKFDDVAQQLLNLGVQAVCVVERLLCRLWTKDRSTEIPAPSVAVNDKPGAREAFSAALIYRLLEIGHDLSTATLDWATAAMATNVSLDEITDSMPEATDVDELLKINQSRSR
ncbi:MAG TPA: PfkB family carbohydrate kinase [Pseudonocardiaceae bacterium]|jgi:ribokinase|nr:PfkB family carbohydrate kinase [Pseudonocardiaceae bacterium]